MHVSRVVHKYVVEFEVISGVVNLNQGTLFLGKPPRQLTSIYCPFFLQ